MHVQALYTYPIKSLRGVSIPSSALTRHGFPYDRRFCIYKEQPDEADEPYKLMMISTHPAMSLFHTELTMPDDQGQGGDIKVTRMLHFRDYH